MHLQDERVLATGIDVRDTAKRLHASPSVLTVGTITGALFLRRAEMYDYKTAESNDTPSCADPVTIVYKRTFLTAAALFVKTFYARHPASTVPNKFEGIQHHTASSDSLSRDRGADSLNGSHGPLLPPPIDDTVPRNECIAADLSAATDAQTPRSGYFATWHLMCPL